MYVIWFTVKYFEKNIAMRYSTLAVCQYILWRAAHLVHALNEA